MQQQHRVKVFLAHYLSIHLPMMLTVHILITRLAFSVRQVDTHHKAGNNSKVTHGLFHT